MMIVWHWPQITWCVLSGLGLWASAEMNGKPKEGNYSFTRALVLTCATFTILYYGGFFAGGCGMFGGGGCGQ